MSEKLELLLALVDIVFIASIVVAFLIGMAKGIRKTCRSLLGFLPALIVFVIFLGPICKGMINFDFVPIVEKVNEILDLEILNTLPEKGSVKELIIYFLNQMELFKTPLTENSELYILIEGIMVSVIKVLVYFSGLSFVTFVAAPIIRGIIRLIGGKIEDKPKMYSRIIGGFMFTAFYLIFCFAWMFPITSGLSIAADYSQAAVELVDNCNSTPTKTNTEEEEYIFDINEKINKATLTKIKKYAEYVSASEKSIALKIISVNNTVDTYLLGNMTKVKTSSGSINYVVMLKDTASGLTEFVSTSIEAGKIKEWDGIIVLAKDVTQVVIENNSIEVFAPIAIELLENTELGENVEFDLEELKAINWDEESTAIGNILVSVLDFAKEAKLDPKDPLKVLENPNLDVHMSKLGKSLQSSQTITKVLLSILNEPLQEILKEKLGEDSESTEALLEILDLNKIAENGDWEKDFENLSNIARALYEVGLFEEELDFSNPEVVKRLLTKPFELSFIKGNEETIIKAMIELLNVSDFLSGYGVTQEKLDLILSDINYESEIQNLSTAVSKLLEEANKYEGSDLKEKIKAMVFAVEEETLNEILSPLFSSELLIRIVPIIIENIFTENDLEGLVSEFVKNSSANPSQVNKADYESEKQIIIDVMMIFQTIDFGENSITIDYILENARNELIDIVAVAITSKFINQDGVVVLMENMINDTLGYEGENEIHFESEVIPQTQEKWKDELTAIKDLLNEINGFDFSSIDIKNPEHIKKIKKIIDALYSSDMLASVTDTILKNEVVGVIEDAVNDTLGYEENEIAINPENIPATSNEWKAEIDILHTIIVNVEKVNSENFNFNNETDRKSLVDILEALCDSQLFSEHLELILESFIPSLGMEIEIEGINFEGAANWDYQVEVEALYQIKEILSNLQADSTSLSSLSNIEEILEIASNSNIASYILGSQINTSLKDAYSETEEEIELLAKYDFSKKDVMTEQKAALSAMLNFGIALGKLKEALDEDNITEEVVQEYSESFAKLSNGDEHYSLVDELLALVIKKELSSNIDMTKDDFALVNYPQEAQAFKNAILSYEEGDKLGALGELSGSILAIKLFSILVA